MALSTGLAPAALDMSPVDRLARTPKRRSSESHLTRKQAMLVLSNVVGRFGAWRSELAIIASRVARPHSEAERVAMRTACVRIATQVSDAHAEIIIGLAGAPQSVRGHSRVVDVEKALDGVEASLEDLRDQLLN